MERNHRQLVLAPAGQDETDVSNTRPVRHTAPPLTNEILFKGDAMDAYGTWPTPVCIISDGAYGVGGFHGDPRTGGSLADWYRPHIEAWSKAAVPSTTLWFWNREIGWAEVHPVLEGHGWQFEQVITWDKGIAHVAGNVNGATIRRFPIVTEVCVFYSRKLLVPTELGPMPAQQWLRYEWQRAGLRLAKANQACGVKNAATRKYMTKDWLWYFPPPEMMSRLVAYANQHGDPTGAPYYSLDGRCPITAEEWAQMRYRWNHTHAISNVWSHPPLHGTERLRNVDGRRHAPRVHNPKAGIASAHLNQKPLDFMRRILAASTSEGDVVWEPFGGLASAAVVAMEMGRHPVVAEIDPFFSEVAADRIESARAEAVLLRA